jgi:hypothetical protein
MLVFYDIFLLGVGTGILGFFITDHLAMISSSYVGAYLAIRPLGWYVGKN